MEPMSMSPMGMVVHIIASPFKLLNVCMPCCSSYNILFNMQPIARDDLLTCQCADNTLWCKEG